MKKINMNHRVLGLAALFFSTTLLASPEWNHHGQATWGALDDSSQTTVPLMYPYAECSIGSHQSPVDLSTAQRERLANPLKIEYRHDTTPDFFNSGHAAQVNLSSENLSRLMIGNEAYPLIQFHFHTPSEHVLGSKTFPAELHFVHIRADGKIAVLGIFLDDHADIANQEFQKVLDNMPTTPATHDQNSGIQLNPSLLLPAHKRHLLSYAGSLTTPPCSEGVNWYVLPEPVSVTKSQISQLQSIYYENHRLPQALNGRSVMIHSH